MDSDGWTLCDCWIWAQNKNNIRYNIKFFFYCIFYVANTMKHTFCEDKDANASLEWNEWEVWHEAEGDSKQVRREQRRIRYKYYAHFSLRSHCGCKENGNTFQIELACEWYAFGFVFEYLHLFIIQWQLIS